MLKIQWSEVQKSRGRILPAPTSIRLPEKSMRHQRVSDPKMAACSDMTMPSYTPDMHSRATSSAHEILLLFPDPHALHSAVPSQRRRRIDIQRFGRQLENLRGNIFIRTPYSQSTHLCVLIWLKSGQDANFACRRHIEYTSNHNLEKHVNTRIAICVIPRSVE